MKEVFLAAAARVLAQHPTDEEGRMPRSPGLRTAGTCYAFVTADDVMVMLPASRVAELVESGRGAPLDLCAKVRTQPTATSGERDGTQPQTTSAPAPAPGRNPHSKFRGGGPGRTRAAE